MYATTPSATLHYAFEVCELSIDELNSMVDTDKFWGMCKSGCVNYEKKWCCPPFSPALKDYVRMWQKIYIIFMRISTSQFDYIKNNYLKIKAGNAILKSRMDSFLRMMSENYGNFISTGSCRLCKPCKCKETLPCAYPTKMTYSLEALGVDVNLLIQSKFSTPLQWYKKGYLPEYTAVVGGLLTNSDLTNEMICNEYKKFDAKKNKGGD